MRYNLSPSHPLKPERLAMTFELASQYGLFDHNSPVEPAPATDSEVLSFHGADYLETVRALSEGSHVPLAGQFGFGYGDNPPFRGMYEASLLYTGASLTAAQLVIAGEARVAFNISGGLHHAKSNLASGFCVFNDPVIAIKHLLTKFDRIAYIDIDAHHGDGVQEAFYETSAVMTISIHESGEYLFPGTGFVQEIGRGEGLGYSVNVPLAPSTGDDVYAWVFREVVVPVVSAYRPQVIVAQLGADTHYTDPLAHLSLTTAGYIHTVRGIINLGKPLIALGGGGYNPSAVARLWTLAYAEMLEVELPDEIPDQFAVRYGVRRLRDSEGRMTSSPQAETYARQTVEALKRSLFPFHGLI